MKSVLVSSSVCGSELRCELRGEAAGITPCSSPPRLDSAYRNSLVFVAMTLSWEPEVQCGVKVKDARSAPHRCVKMQ
jgi:hypothetical protein